MAGCFGNDPYDRYVEGQLYRYLDDCDNYEVLCEFIMKDITEAQYSKYSDLIDKYINYLARKIESGILSLEEAQRIIAKAVAILK